MSLIRSMTILTLLLVFCACASSTVETATGTAPEAAPLHPSEPDAAILWVANAAEYHAISMQVYAQATRDLPRLIADESFSALPGHDGASGKPPAIILDVDETVTSGIGMELTMLPFTGLRQYEWSINHKAVPIRGVTEFVNTAKRLGVDVFFVTNRPCELVDGNNDTCPQKQSTIDDVVEIGIDTDADHVLLADEIPEWNREKQSRREYIADTHRIIMLIGDDYGDFIACTRAKPLTPCTVAATISSRAEALDTYKKYWGNGWYILPNPMYGSWTSVE